MLSVFYFIYYCYLSYILKIKNITDNLQFRFLIPRINIVKYNKFEIVKSFVYF